ncbi:hypothetical protein N9T87_01145 [bacterium]|nr:hypothetical protein [bacterium]
MCILLFTCLGFTQDTLITKQGKQYIGKVIDSDSKSVEFFYPEWDSPKKFYLNSAEVFLEPKVPKSYPIYEASKTYIYKNYKNYKDFSYNNYKDNKNKLKKQKYLSFSIKNRAIYDAKIKARKWVMFPTLAYVTSLGTFSILDASFNSLTEASIVGALSVASTYFTLDAWDNISKTQLILHNYNDFEKQIYLSSYKKTLRRRKILYSTLGIPMPIFISFMRAMANLSAGPYTGLK